MTLKDAFWAKIRELHRAESTGRAYWQWIREYCHLPHVSPFIRNAPVAFRRKYSRNPATAGAPRRFDDHDLHARFTFRRSVDAEPSGSVAASGVTITLRLGRQPDGFSAAEGSHTLGRPRFTNARFCWSVLPQRPLQFPRTIARIFVLSETEPTIYQRPLLGVCLPLQVAAVRDAGHLYAFFPGEHEVEIFLLGIIAPPVSEPTVIGHRMLADGMAARDLAYDLITAHRKTLCVYLPEPPFDRGFLRTVSRPQARLGGIVFLDDCRTLQGELFAAGVVNRESEATPWLGPQTTWPTRLSRVPGNGQSTPRRAAAAGSGT